MRILGLVGSARRMGNTEVLVTEVARAASALPPSVPPLDASRVPADTAEAGAAKADADTPGIVRLVRLSELRLLVCNGCMACAFRGDGQCPLQDDMEFLLAEMEAADAFILGAPTYTLLPPAPVKAWADRFIMALAREKKSAPKPAVVVGVAALVDWSRHLLPILNGLVMAYGFRLVDSMIAYAPGPAEVLLEHQNVSRATAAGRKLRLALAGQDLRPDFGPGRCPVCGSDLFRIVDSVVECGVCMAKGKLVDQVATFESRPAHRWEPEALRHHFHDWIRASGPSYLAKRPEVRRLQRAYRLNKPWWIRPPGDG
ncbi:MAG: flavodoxin family protein [Polyangiaceae bacterium]|nr:flavodoxin family protein [Polyangiaceae bacterium]